MGFPKVACPFKLKPVWIGEETFEVLVKDVWMDPGLDKIIGSQRRLVGKISTLKCRVKNWAKEKCLQDMRDLNQVEETLEIIYE
jgi:hypothetical protein